MDLSLGAFVFHRYLYILLRFLSSFISLFFLRLHSDGDTANLLQLYVRQQNTLTSLSRTLDRMGPNIRNQTIATTRGMGVVYILKIDENATLEFSISSLHGLFNQNVVFIKQLYFTYPIKRLLFALIDCQYALFKIACSKTSYQTPCHVAHE